METLFRKEIFVNEGRKRKNTTSRASRRKWDHENLRKYEFVVRKDSELHRAIEAHMEKAQLAPLVKKLLATELLAKTQKIISGTRLEK